MDLHVHLARSIISGLSGDVGSVALGGLQDDGTDTTPHSREILYALGYVTFRDFAGNRFHGSQPLWDIGLQMVDALCARQGADGSWKWRVPASGKVWSTRYVWSVYAWLRAIEDFGEHFGEERLERFREALGRTIADRLLSWNLYLKTGERRTSLNIFIWEGLEMWLGGRVLGNDEWLRAGREQVEYCLRRQKPDGWWPDAQRPRGPVVSYNGVTLSAASVYARLSGDAFALETVRRAARFHTDFCYPDGSLVETIDERNRYGKRKVSQSRAGQDRLVWAFAPFEETRAAAVFFAGHGEGSVEDDVAPSVDTAVSSCADVLDAVRPGDVEPAAAPDRLSVYDIPALVRRRAPWLCCLSGGTTEVRGSLFHHDRQNHLSVWHDDYGLLVGGGNSLWDASFSTVRLGGRYLAAGGQVRADADDDVLTLRFAHVLVHVAVRILDGRSIRFAVRTEGSAPADSEFALFLPRVHGKVFEQWGTTKQLGEESVYMDWAIEPGRLLSCRVGAALIEADTPGMVTWPHQPVSIYNVPARLPIEEAVLRVAIPISSELGVVTLRVD